MIFNRVEKSNKSRSESSVTSPKPTPAGRERLQHFEIEISKAHEAVEDLQQRVARLAAIDGASNDAERALQNAINADGGRALAAHSNGQTKPGDEIARLIAAAKVSSESAAATKTALPYAESLLENARQQLASLIDQRAAEVTRVIATLADADVRAYEQSWQETCEWHDRLVGFASVAQHNAGEIHILEEPPRIARFSASGDSTAQPFLNHSTNSRTVSESAKRWSEIRSRLESSASAELADLN